MSNVFLFRPKSSRTLGVKMGLKSPRQLLERQIHDLEGRMDTLNAELAQVMKTESDLNFAVNEFEEKDSVPEERLEAVRQQLNNIELQKENLLKKFDHLGEECRKKKKELNQLK